MNITYTFNKCSRRVAVLLLASMGVFSSVQAQTVTTVNANIIHRQSFMATKADGGLNFPHEFLQSGQGMIQKQVGNSTISIQNTSTYRMTRYVKQGVAVPLYLTTSQSTSGESPQRTYQRWYNYDTEEPLVNGTNCDLSKGTFRVLRYNNGLVMGTAIRGGGTAAAYHAQYNFWGILPAGTTRLNIGADLSCYKDLSYATGNNNTTAANSGNLTEPSLTLRHIYELVDAKVMANELVTKTGNNWLEEHTIHFPNISTLVFQSANDGSNFVPLNMELENYWFYTGNGNATNANLQNLINNDYVEVTSETSVANMGVTLIGLREAPNTNANGVTNSTLARRRLIGFRYNTVPADSRLTIYVRSKDPNNANRKYNVAKFNIIFDANSEVVPYMDVVPENSAKHSRSTQSLREACNGADPVAHIDFDYPHNPSYTTPTGGIHFNGSEGNGNVAHTHSSALPLAFEKTSYAYSPIANAGTLYAYCVWGSYAIVDYVNQSGTLYPASTVTNDALTDTDPGFLYIDASDMPGTVASVPFEGTFCMGTKMMCSGWMSSVTNNVPGSVILKVIGRKADNTEKEIFAYCPGQIGKSYRRAGATTIAAGSDMTWQQFYFEFFLNEPCVGYELKIENNCVSTSGGDYFLDDVWVFAQLPKVGPQLTTPLCGGDLDVIQLETNFESLLLSTGLEESTTTIPEEEREYLSFIYLDWDNFLLRFQEGLAAMGVNVSGHDLQANINSGMYDVAEYKAAYQAAFAESIMRDTVNHNIVYGNFKWSPCFADHPTFSFAEMALDEGNTVYGESLVGGQRRLVFNGAMGGFEWEFYHNYALLTTLHGRDPMTSSELDNIEYITEFLFNVLNECSNRSILWFVPKIQIVGTIGGMSIEDLEFCQNTNQTFAMELTGYTKKEGYVDQDGEHEDGEYVVMDEVYFDWWMGVPKSEGVDSIPATVENYMRQYTTYYEEVDGEQVERRIYLYDAVRCFRFMNPDATTLYDPNIKFGSNPLYQNIAPFTERMLEYMRSLANPADGSKPQLYIHTKIVDIEINDENIVNEIYLGDTIKYVKFVAIPIEANINEAAKDFVYICAEPQPFKVKVSDHAPFMSVGFSDKHYPAGLGTLSVRISKSQFEKLVDHGDGVYNDLHIPLRDINVITPKCIGIKKDDTAGSALGYVRIANSTDSIMQRFIMDNIVMDENNSWVPAVGKIDYLVGRADQFWENGEEERLLKIHFDEQFQVREGYSYTLRYYFIEDLNEGLQFTCNGNGDIILKIVPDYEVWTGGAGNTDWSNDENWRRADYDDLYAYNGTNLKDRYLPNGKEGDDPNTTNFVTPADRSRMQGFAPLYVTNILMMTSEKAPASELYDDGDEVDGEGNLTGFPALRSTASPLIRYDFQAHEWTDTDVSYRTPGDMITELYVDNVCDSIAFQPETELVNAHLLDYTKAWVEFALSKNLWSLASSPLQGTISGEWYAPTWSGRQETTYFEPINFDVTNHIEMKGISGTYPSGLDYDRFAPAVYQRQWDKAKAVLYERGAVWSADDASQTENLGHAGEGDWTGSGQAYQWDSTNADDYLNRLVYKPFGDSKINVAVRGSWSGAHNDHTVPYDNGGFSVMPINNLKSPYNSESVRTVFRLPKDDQYYDIWDWTKGYAIERRVRVYINDGREMPDGATATNTVTLNNRGRLRSDYFATPDDGTTAPEEYEVTLKNEGQGSIGYFLAGNPFICGLDMQKFFEKNSNVIMPYFLVMKNSELDPKNPDLNPNGTSWKWTDMNFAAYDDGEGSGLQGQTIVPARYGFFVKSKGDNVSEITLKYTTDMMTHTPRTASSTPDGLHYRGEFIIHAERDGNQSDASVIKSAAASNQFLPEEDLATFTVSDISSSIPVVYTLTGRLATSINRIHDFMVLPIGIESNSDEPATVTFQGVESLGDSLMLYDAKTDEAVPLYSGMSTRMPGRTQNRFFIVQASSIQRAIAESSLQIYGEDGIVVVTSTTGQPITEVNVFDVGGRRVYSAKPDFSEHRFRMPKGVYVVTAKTDALRQVKKISY